MNPLRRIGRFSFLLLMLASILVLVPFLPHDPGDVSLFRVLFTGTYLAGLAAVSGRGRVLWVGAALVLPAAVSEWTSLFYGQVAIMVVKDVFTALFLAYTAGVILRTILRQQRVTADTVLGGLCIYLLIGFFFVNIYSLIEFLVPNSFSVYGVPYVRTGAEGLYARYPAILYYSFVTLTTLGYGDITPLSSHARGVAVLEAVLGQLFVAVFIARLVALHITHEGRRGA